VHVRGVLSRFEITDAALRPIAEMVHDIDLKDEKYGRPQTAGIELVVNGIAMAHREDEARLGAPRPYSTTCTSTSSASVRSADAAREHEAGARSRVRS